ncbi:hypothetical protein Hdeb2414_s0017g00512821 [Helianthus debilis subsp. tardiflorus]
MCMIVAQTLNHPYNFSKLIFEQMKSNLTSDRWLMYTRFVQMLLDDLLPNLEINKSDLLSLEYINNLSLDIVNTYKNQVEEDIPKFEKLIGFLGNKDYVAPPKDRWKKDGSNSYSEDKQMEGFKEKRSKWFVKESAKPKKATKQTKRKQAPQTMLRDEDSEDDVISATSEKDTGEKNTVEIADDVVNLMQRGSSHEADDETTESEELDILV